MTTGTDAAIPLTEREQEIAMLLADGLTNAEIAERLGITFATAKWHVSQVLSKLEVQHREQVFSALAAQRSRKPARHRRWPAWGFGGLSLSKGLGVAAAVVPVAGVALAGAAVLRSAGGEGSAESPLAASVVTPTRTIPIPDANSYPMQPHSCDWQSAQANINSGGPSHAGCDFTGVDFGGVAFNYGDLGGAKLEDAVFRGATLYLADLSGANLRGTWFIEAVMGGVNFDGADLTGAHFTMSIADGTFRGATCPDGEPADSKPRGTCIGSPGMTNLPETRSFAGIESLVGSVAPQFALPNARDGAQIIAGPEAGRSVLLWWVAGWCHRCENQVEDLRRFIVERPDVLVIGLSIDADPAGTLAFLEAHGLDIPVAVDTDLELADAYEVVGSATMVSITRDGTIHSFANWAGWAPSAYPDFLKAIP